MLKSALRFILSQSYLATMAVAVLCGMFIPHAHDLTQWNTVYLQIIFFMSCLKLDIPSYVQYIKDWKFLVLAALAVLLFEWYIYNRRVYL